MQVLIVLGTGFGDEGKGNVTNWLTKEDKKSLVVRFNGGHQAGHTVIHNDKRHVFSSFGSGTLNGTPTFWSKYCTIFPTGFIREFDALSDLGSSPEIYVDPLCPITTPFDIDDARFHESNLLHGSCGSGFGKTIWRHETLDHSYRIFAKDLCNEWILREKLKYLSQLVGGYGQYEIDVENFIRNCQHFCNRVVFISEQDFPITNFDNIVFEGAQGILLDREHGIFPHVTRSHTTSKNALEICQRWGIHNPEIHYVSRCYQTRHGNGPLLGETSTSNLELIGIENETNVTNRWQGEFRYAPFSPELFDYSIRTDKCYSGENCKRKFVFTCMDQFEDYIPILDKDGIAQTIKKETFMQMFPKNDIIFSFSPDMSTISQ